jgi:hypothetical protein
MAPTNHLPRTRVIPMEVRYRPTPEDLDALVQYCAENRLTARGGFAFQTFWILFAVVLLLSGLGFVAAVAQRQVSLFEAVVALGIFGLLLSRLIFRKGLTAGSRTRALRRDWNADQFPGELRLAVTPEGLLADTQLIPWRAIQAIAVTPDHAFFCSSAAYSSPPTACVLPRRAFENEQQFTAFVETARGHQEAAREAEESAGEM